MNHAEKMDHLLKRRSDCVISLEKSLKHLPLARIISILTSWMDIKTLEELTKFQQERN